ncbi:MAG: hypothetical protein A4E52_01162 [Pelotomaculum sp. PtaB.Bin013]|uniref:DUF3800 domain-containing protein n=1 Tax=Pelotomaculum isophthalicicum JI TaxID=947010 RepID=A0A9X4H6T4_9FIRM|nr:DUF3800 domain-containing protein [Pelotomaculum isophthalicicum]MDF9408714.1 DUF3800 domain-containing protein [Pelotomaculum isophthalicicum JI]OPX88852.1 MAG: hypothetical protein A4E52_01162 [Pelotomaculum sp. PtaB.Bin013]
MIIYVEESGFQKNWTFVAVKIFSEKSARSSVNKWRHYAASISKKFVANEYKDCKTPDQQRQKMLHEISVKGFQFWVVHFVNYRGHKKDYSEAIVKLLMDVDLTDVSLIVLDKVERSKRYMDKHIEKIREEMLCPCNVRWGLSEKEKGIQIADAICGAASRDFNNMTAPSFFYLIKHLKQGVKIIVK